MEIRRAVPEDAPGIAAIHVAGWRETYGGILPDDYLASLSVERRTEMWRRVLLRGEAVHLAPGAGFAIVAAQRDPGLAAEWPDELQALYVLRAHQGQGLGRALLRAALGDSGRPFSAFVLEGNAGALAFYIRTGAVELFRRPDRIGEHPVIDIALGWPEPASV
jgi:ribosomal protein S18 acetylase RimI-like enzyme